MALFTRVNTTTSVTHGQENSTEPGLPHSHAYYALCYCTLILAIIFGNVLVCLAVLRERTLQTTTNYLVVSLAVADLLVATLVMPWVVYLEKWAAELLAATRGCWTWQSTAQLTSRRHCWEEGEGAEASWQLQFSAHPEGKWCHTGNSTQPRDQHQAVSPSGSLGSRGGGVQLSGLGSTAAGICVCPPPPPGSGSRETGTGLL
ncbi:unnamed protein product [Lepidochelys kempii]